MAYNRIQISQRSAMRQKLVAGEEEYYRNTRQRMNSLNGRTFLEQIRNHANAKGLDRLPQYTRLQIVLSKVEKDLQTTPRLPPTTKEAIIKLLLNLEKSAPGY